MAGYDDKQDPGNSPQYHTGKRCVGDGCENPAGTAWSPLWCVDCNIERIQRINKCFEELLDPTPEAGRVE